MNGHLGCIPICSVRETQSQRRICSKLACGHDSQCVRKNCYQSVEAGVKVSVDLNFRKKLWSSEKAQKVMTNLMQYVDVCIGNEEDAEKVLGFKPGETDVTSGELELAGYKSIFEQMVEKFNFEYVPAIYVKHFS